MASARNQSFNFSMPAETPAGTTEKRFQLDREYSRATGMVAYVNSDGGVPLRIGLRTDEKDVLNLVNIDFLKAGVDCPKPARMTPVELKADGTDFIIMMNFSNPLGSILSVDVVFSLIKD